MRVSRAVFLIMVGVFAGHFLYHYPNLPERMASHFDGAGAANDWIPKQGMLAIWSALLLFAVLLAVIPPFLIERSPLSMLNLPNKEYWFSEERRAATIGVFRNYSECFATGLLVVFSGINEMVFRANLRYEAFNSKIALILILGFLLFAAVWLTKFVRHFRITV